MSSTSEEAGAKAVWIMTGWHALASFVTVAAGLLEEQEYAGAGILFGPALGWLACVGKVDAVAAYAAEGLGKRWLVAGQCAALCLLFAGGAGAVAWHSSHYLRTIAGFVTGYLLWQSFSTLGLGLGLRTPAAWAAAWTPWERRS